MKLKLLLKKDFVYLYHGKKALEYTSLTVASAYS